MGKGINEGYTELLNLRYFSHSKKRTAYIEQVNLSKGIEEIVGKEKMEQLYFSAVLDGLIKELTKYTSLEQAQELIGIIDVCHRYNSKQDNNYKDLAGDARVIIANIKRTNDLKLFREGKITAEEYNFRNFKSYCYLKDEDFIKYGDNYAIGPHYMTRGKFIPKEGYDIIMKNFINSDIFYQPYTSDDEKKTRFDLQIYVIV